VDLFCPAVAFRILILLAAVSSLARKNLLPNETRAALGKRPGQFVPINFDSLAVQLLTFIAVLHG
jgi:hypothetical protein